MALDHALGSQMGLDAVTEHLDASVLLQYRVSAQMEEARDDREWDITTNPKPVRALGTKAQTLELETNAGLAWPILVVNALLVAFLGEAQQWVSWV